MSPSRETEDEGKGVGEAFPGLLLGGEVPATSGSEGIEARAAIVLGDAPLCRRPSPCLETVQRRVERAVVDAQRAAGDDLNRLRELPAARGPRLQQLEHDQIERPLEEIDLAFAHGPLSSWRRIGEGTAAPPCGQ